MKNVPQSSFGLLIILSLFACMSDSSSETKGPSELLTKVDPFIGTGLHGHVYPGATVPFGAVQLSPDNGTAGWDWCSGYNWDSDTIVGFSHTHLSGTGIGDLCDLSMMPLAKSVDFAIKASPKQSSYAAKFSHDNESAYPGFYEVKLDNGINVELTAGQRSGYHRYHFPNTINAAQLIDLGFSINWDKPVDTYIEKIDDHTIIGHRLSKGWAEDQRLYFVAKYNQKITDILLADSTTISPNNLRAKGRQIRAQLSFGKISTLEVNVGISTSSIEAAIENLKEDNTTFDSALVRAKELWEKELNKIQVEGIDESTTKAIYTALYRTCLAPVVMSDVNNTYKSPGGKIESTEPGTKRYDILSLWDTFRAANPLHTITQADKVNDIINTFLAHYDEYGLLPVWSLLGNETNCMTGYHSVPIIVDAYFKGFDGFDAERALEAMQASAAQNIRATDLYREYGYIPHDKAGQSVTRTLEYAFDDWCIAVMAEDLGNREVADEFFKRSKYYEALFDPRSKFMRAKLADGTWKQDFDPVYSEHNWDIAEYTEGNAWQHSWFVPHNPKGLIDLHGGDDAFNIKLDSLFTISSEVKGENKSADISGLIGQYAHGNEPSHHIAYLYNYSGAPYKAQAILDNIMQSQYNDTPYGLCGNEDCGQMSAWYVFSALGFYPVNAAQGLYVIGRPMIHNATINLENGKSFNIKVSNNSKQNKYIASINLNGKSLENSYILHSDLVNGGSLDITMSNKPNTTWAVNQSNRPPSYTIK